MKSAEGDIQSPDFMVCLDSGALNYEKLWVTSSLRGIVMWQLSI
jgi:hypothetical protein